MTPRPALSTRQASPKTAEAADRLLGWLEQQRGLPDRSGDGQPEPGHPAGDGAEAPSSDPSAPPTPEDTARGLEKAPGQGTALTEP